jgi:hypothetical protein
MRMDTGNRIPAPYFFHDAGTGAVLPYTPDNLGEVTQAATDFPLVSAQVAFHDMDHGYSSWR